LKISEKAFRFSQPENGNFQRQSAILRTARKRPDLLSKAELTPAERAIWRSGTKLGGWRVNKTFGGKKL